MAYEGDPVPDDRDHVLLFKIARDIDAIAGGEAGDATAANQATQITAEQAILAALNARLGKGAANLASSQVALSTSAATVAIARSTRRSVLIRNLDTSISVYIGPATVTSGNGMLLKAGESLAFTFVGLLQGIAASGTPSVAVSDEYD